MNSIDDLIYVNKDDYTVVSTEVGRSKEACYDHWGKTNYPNVKD